MRKIITYKEKEASLLKKKSISIKEIDSSVKDLIKEMKEVIIFEDTKEEDYNAAGLAAPQIGINKKIFILYIDNKFKVFINPEIIKKSGPEKESFEGCLSFPHIFVPIKRPSRVTIRYQNEKGLNKKIKAKGFLATAIQHECDHLNGIILSDKNGFKLFLNKAEKEGLTLEEYVKKIF